MDSELNDVQANIVEAKREAIRRTREAVDIVNTKLGLRMAYPEVRFALRGTTAGRAWYREHLIEYNPTLLHENVEDFLRQTVRHEVAHLAARNKFGAQIKPHGKEWANCCWYLQIPAKRCHNYDVGGVPTRAQHNNGSRIKRTESGLVVLDEGMRVTQFED
jgi:predicted SprT family Zn-dependent metalloprotease